MKLSATTFQCFSLVVFSLSGCEQIYEENQSHENDFSPLEYDCSVFPDQADSEYILPYEIGRSFIANPHAARVAPDTQNTLEARFYYAIDIAMPIGTPVVASRGGIVVYVREDFENDDNDPGHENAVIVEHDDRSISRYFHLSKDGALVNVGDYVLQYQTIALSGNTGNSTGPHLHFEVANEFCNIAPSNNVYRSGHCQTLPVSFYNTYKLDCGLEYNKRYLALSY